MVSVLNQRGEPADHSSSEKPSCLKERALALSVIMSEYREAKVTAVNTLLMVY